ncbi:MAG TPA: hypothetical protein DEB60_05965 [Brevundimonas sp.]|nr:hypothetical protein [Brevundimonas sp.]
MSTPGHWGEDGQDDGNILVLRSANFLKAGGLNYETAALRKFDAKKLVQKRLEPGDLLLERSGGSPAQPVGRVNRFDAQGDFSASNFLQILRVRDKVDDWFAYYLLDSFYAQGGTEHLQKATTGIRNLDFATYLATTIFLPPLDEQRRIAEVLRSADEAIRTAELAASGAKSARMALLADLLHRADWEPERALPSGWHTPLLDMMAKRGSGHTPSKQFSSYWNGDVKWISLQDTKRLDRVYVTDTAATITPEGLANSSAVLHPANTVVVSRDATVGRSAIMMSDMAVSQHFISYTCGPALSPLYLYYWLQRMKSVFERIGAGSTIKTIGLPFFKGLKIAIPDRAEQDWTAELLWQADSQVFAAEEAIDRLRLVKAAVSDDLLSGHIRVPA